MKVSTLTVRSVRNGAAELHGHSSNNTRRGRQADRETGRQAGRCAASHSPDCAAPESNSRQVRRKPRQLRVVKAAAADVAGFMVRCLASYPLCKIHMSGSGSVSFLGTIRGANQ